MAGRVGTDEDDNQNNEIKDSERNMGDDGNLDEDQKDFPGSSGNVADIDGVGPGDEDNYANTAGKYTEQVEEDAAEAMI